MIEQLNSINNTNITKLKLEQLLSDDFPRGFDVHLVDIIPVEQLQPVQDEFSFANGVSSIIVDLEGKPITEPNNFKEYCASPFHKGEKCIGADRVINNIANSRQRCRLLEATMPLYIGGKHLADWKIGMCGFGGVIGPFLESACDDPEIYEELYIKMSDMIKNHFDNVCKTLKLKSEEVSEIGYTNIRLARELLIIKEHEAKLAEDEGIFRSIFENSEDGIVLVGENGIVKEWSHGYEKLSGITKEEAVGQNFWDLAKTMLSQSVYSEDDVDKMHVAFIDVLSQKKRMTLVRHIYNRKTKQEKITQTNYFPVALADSVMLGGTIRDITNIMEKERELIAEKERLQSLGDNLPDGALYQLVLDTRTGNFQMAYVSARWEAVTGASAEAVMNDAEALFNTIHPADLPELMKLQDASAQTMSKFNCEVRIATNDKNTRWAQITSHPHLENDLIIWNGIIFDITERKKTELELEEYRDKLELQVKERTEEFEATNEELYATNEELYATNEELHDKNDKLQQEMTARREIMQKLEDSESKMRNFIGQSFEGIVIIDEEGKIIEWNSAQERITGISAEEAIGKYSWDLYKSVVHDESSEKFRDHMLSFLKSSNEIITNETEHVLHPVGLGDARYVTMTSFQIALADKCYVGEIVRDITERKLIDIELESYRSQLEEMVTAQTQELTESKERLTSISDNLPGGVIYQMSDRNSMVPQFTYISAHFAEMFLTSVEDVMEDTSLFFSLLHPDDGAKLIDLLCSPDQDGFVDLECRIILNTGEMRWIHLRWSYHLQSDGSHAWDGFIIDVTEKMIAEHELEETRRRQNILIKVLQIVQSSENLFESINAALAEMGRYAGVSRSYIFEKTHEGKVVSNTHEWCEEGINPEIENLQNVPIESMQNWFDTFAKGKYICTSDISTLPQNEYEILEPQGIKSILVLPLNANGVNYGFVGFDECSQHREWQQNEIELIISLSQIISAATLRYHAEESVRESEEMYRQLTVASPDAIIVINPDGKIIYLSPRAKELLLINDVFDIGNKTVTDYVHPHDVKKAREMFKSIIEGDSSVQPQMLLIREDGSEFFGEISSASVKDDDGTVASVIMVLRDITERKASEMELIQAKEKAEESDKLKSSFLANMSHEIRTPINGINGFINFIADENLSSKRRNEYVTIVHNSCAQLIRIIDDIIDIAKIEAQQLTIRPMTFHLNEFMVELYTFFESYLQANKKDKVVMIIDDSQFIEECTILSDPTRLRQVITNLITNASKFTEKGYIRFGYRLLEHSKLEFYVEDTGIGLPPNQVEVIFERFRQVELTNHRKYGGTGLGLTISRSLVQMMGGSIHAESVEGDGSTFIFTISYFPVTPEDEPVFAELRKEKPEDELFFPGTSILLVEPEVMSTRYYEKILTYNGATPISVHSVSQWIDAMNQQKHIDMVLVDANVFQNEDEEAFSNVKSVRAGLPTILLVPERNEYYNNIIDNISCTRIIEGTPDYMTLCEEIMRCI